MIDLNKLAKENFHIAQKRKKINLAINENEPLGNFVSHNGIETLKHCASEVVEAMDAYREWVDKGICANLGVESYTYVTKCKKHVAEEFADVITCILTLAGQEGIDIEKALLDVKEKNLNRCSKPKNEKHCKHDKCKKEKCECNKENKDTNSNLDELKKDIWESMGGIAK